MIFVMRRDTLIFAALVTILVTVIAVKTLELSSGSGTMASLKEKIVSVQFFPSQPKSQFDPFTGTAW